MLNDVMMDPEVYRDPMKWEPNRYFPDRAEDKKVPYAFCGWGAGRHPCCKSLSLCFVESLLTEYLVGMRVCGYPISSGTRMFGRD